MACDGMWWHVLAVAESSLLSIYQNFHHLLSCIGVSGLDYRAAMHRAEFAVSEAPIRECWGLRSHEFTIQGPSPKSPHRHEP